MLTDEEHAKKAVDAWVNEPLDGLRLSNRGEIAEDLVPWIAEEIGQAKAAALQTAITAIGALESDGQDRTIDDAIDAVRTIMKEDR